MAIRTPARHDSALPLRMGEPVIAVERSNNKKTGHVSATYVSQAACPYDCPLFGAGCYAESGAMAFHTRRLNDSPEENTDAIAASEARAIDTLSGERPLRLHVVGDCPSDRAATQVSEAVARYSERGGGAAWTYTHAWRRVARASWGDVSVSASCESADDIATAKAAGYATVVVYDPAVTGSTVKTFVLHDAAGEAHTVIPCLHQNGRTNCEGCPNLCRNDANMRARNITVGFASHGARAGSVNQIVNAKQKGE